jgi:hypothetical protein
MCFEMDHVKSITCPHFKSSADGDLCSVVMDQIENVADAEIRFCMGRHYEACYVYVKSLRRTNSQSIAMPQQL